MKMNVECLLRDSMKTKPKSNRGARQKTSTPKNVTRMNYNENPYGMSDAVKKVVTDASLNSYMYQDFYAVDLKKQLADLYGLTVDHVCIGAGSSRSLICLVKYLSIMGTKLCTVLQLMKLSRIWSAITEVSVSFSH